MEKKERKMVSMLLGLLLYVCLSATGLTLIKLGLNRNSSLMINGSGFSLQFSWLLIVGMCLYVLSFLTSLIVMKGMNLNIYYPLSAGLIYVLVGVLSIIVLKEKVSVWQLVGMVIIFAGIIVMNLGKGN
ncbi:MAG: hypothetical protein J6B50_12575 [Lachnospiraceae bacterium]|nr:hypothetical protein [Lachnospiraceae bacterium]